MIWQEKERKDDTGLDNTKELSALMEDRKVWLNVVLDVGRPEGLPK